MRRTHRVGLTALAVAACLAAACGDDRWDPVDGRDAVRSSAEVRATRRAYDGAPPTIPHEDLGASCSACHNADGMPVEGLGFAPASPHDETANAGATQRCRQCHVFVSTDRLFVANGFQGLAQDLRRGERMAANSPPTIPHGVLMRENCPACHTGPGARLEITSSHPERARCRQCHVPVTTRDRFTSAFGEGIPGEEGS